MLGLSSKGPVEDGVFLFAVCHRVAQAANDKPFSSSGFHSWLFNELVMFFHALWRPYNINTSIPKAHQNPNV